MMPNVIVDTDDPYAVEKLIVEAFPNARVIPLGDGGALVQIDSGGTDNSRPARGTREYERAKKRRQRQKRGTNVPQDVPPMSPENPVENGGGQALSPAGLPRGRPGGQSAACPPENVPQMSPTNVPQMSPNYSDTPAPPLHPDVARALWAIDWAPLDDEERTTGRAGVAFVRDNALKNASDRYVIGRPARRR